MDFGVFMFGLLSCNNAVQALFSYNRCGAFLCLFVHTANECSAGVKLCVFVCVYVCVCACVGEVSAVIVLLRLVLTNKCIGGFVSNSKLVVILRYLTGFAPTPPSDSVLMPVK